VNAAERLRQPAPAAGVRNRHDQRLAALQRANAVRMARAATKRVLQAELDAERSRSLGALLLRAPAPELRTMPVLDLLLSCRGVGTAKAKRLLREARVSERRRLEQLTEREQAAVSWRLLRIGNR